MKEDQVERIIAVVEANPTVKWQRMPRAGCLAAWMELWAAHLNEPLHQRPPWTETPAIVAAKAKWHASVKKCPVCDRELPIWKSEESCAVVHAEMRK